MEEEAFNELLATITAPEQVAETLRAHPTMTIAQAIEIHKKAWGLDEATDQALDHEIGHLLLELIDFENPQGNWRAEFFVMAIENSLRRAALKLDPKWSVDAFAENISLDCRFHCGQDNLTRSMTALVCKETGETPESLHRRLTYDDRALYDEAARHGILLQNATHANGQYTSWQVAAPDGTQYKFNRDDITPTGTILPEGVTPFVSFTRDHVSDVFAKINDMVTGLIETAQQVDPENKNVYHDAAHGKKWTGRLPTCRSAFCLTASHQHLVSGTTCCHSMVRLL